VSKKYFSGLTKNTFLLTLTSLFADISTEMLYPVLPIFLTQVLGAGGAVVGIVEGVAVASQNIIQGLSGYISDKLQRRKPIAVVGYAIAAISKPFIGLSTSWWGVFAARTVDRLASGSRSAPRDGLIANSVDEKNRGKAFGLEGIGDNLGAFLGPILAILLLYSFKVPIRSIFYLAIIPGLIAVIMILFVQEKKGSFSVKSKLDLSVKAYPPAYRAYLAAIAVFGIGNISSSFMILETRNIGISLETTIFIYAFYNLFAAVVSYPTGVLSDKLGRKKVLLSALLLFLIALVGFAATKSYWLIAVCFLLYGIFQGMFRSVGKAFASDIVASAVGWFNTVVGLSGLIASILAGQLYDKAGHPAVFLTAAAFVAAGGLALLRVENA
jgi:MFS family permease